ncbi:unnamed protein product [Paramecium sonneborni]|uniref:Uncharacterized protein n=1 Tax=Paramecium sonneborni TaxID=65129 RepID=A0A8S1RU22_9CILI|nr:unnamed protein product [Paramecium sonneborni]
MAVKVEKFVNYYKEVCKIVDKQEVLKSKNHRRNCFIIFAAQKLPLKQKEYNLKYMSFEVKDIFKKQKQGNDEQLNFKFLIDFVLKSFSPLFFSFSLIRISYSDFLMIRSFHQSVVHTYDRKQQAKCNYEKETENAKQRNCIHDYYKNQFLYFYWQTIINQNQNYIYYHLFGIVHNS